MNKILYALIVFFVIIAFGINYSSFTEGFYADSPNVMGVLTLMAAGAVFIMGTLISFAIFGTSAGTR